jgi:hypothetical protein
MIGWTNKRYCKDTKEKEGKRDKNRKEQGKGRSNMWKLSETLP